jgi:prepilin-type N-terminal cleavage/methylation domain-containing protein
MRGFTLIELLTVVAILLLFSAVLLVVTQGVRDDARTAVVFKQMESAHAAVTKCLFDRKVMYCAGKQYAFLGMPIGEQNCRDHATNKVVSHVPAMSVVGAALVYDADSALCGEGDVNFTETQEYGTWPDIAQYGFRYGTRAESHVQQGIFAFYAFDETPNADGAYTVVCCTQAGCEASARTSADMAFSGGNTHWPMTGFCLERAGFSFDGGDPQNTVENNKRD